jgi:flagellum-specific ATP synthase
VRSDGRPTGAITALFTVLVDGGDHDEPIADAVRGILDGHIVMDRKIAERGRFPAIDVLKSVSRTLPGCQTMPERELNKRARQCLSAYANMEEPIKIGAYRAGADPITDRAIALNPALEGFLSQTPDDICDMATAFSHLESILNQGLAERVE